MIVRRVRGIAALLALVLSEVALSASEPTSVLASRVARLAADPRTTQVTPATVVAKIRPLVELKGDPASEVETTFSGADPARGVAWARVVFQAASKAGQWQFLQLQLGLVPAGEEQSLARAIAAEMMKRLGAPKKPASNQAERLQTWSLGKLRVVALREGVFENPIDNTRAPVVLVEIAIVQGERD